MRADSARSSASSKRAEPWRKVSEIDHACELVERGDRAHRLGRADQHRERRDGERFDAAFAQRGDRQGAGALGEALAAGVGQQIVVAEDGRGARQRLENLDLHRGIGDVILAADDMGDAEVDVVDDRGQV